MVINEKRVHIVSSQINMPALLFIASVTLSLVAGNINWIIQGTMRASTAAQLGGWMLYVFPAALMLFTMNQVKEIKALRTIVYLFLGGSMLYALSFVATPLSRVFTTGGFSAMFWLWAPVLALGQTIFNEDLSWKKRAGFGLIGLIIIAISWSFGRQEWVSGWLPALVAIIVMVWLRSWRFGMVATVFGVLIGAISYTTLQSSLWTSTQQYSTTSRFETYPIMFSIISANPLIGLGMGNYHFYTPLYSLMGWHVQFNSHNQYIDILAQTGIAGLSLFVWMMIALGAVGMRLRGVVQDGFSKGYIAAVLGGLVGMLASGMLGDWFLPFLYNVGMNGFQSVSYTWVFIGGIGAIEQLNRRVKP
jgi:O-antigen ligase